jgi:Avidin family
MDISGKWYNQHGSELDLRVASDGRLSGTLRSGVGFPDPSEEFAVTGFVSEGLVGFSVNFARYDSLTCWTGHCGTEDGRETMYTLWHMSVGLPGAAHADRLWEGIWSGSDTFLRERVKVATGRGRRVVSHPTASAERES